MMSSALLLNEIYYIFNKGRLDLIFSKKDVSSIKKSDVLYYLLKVSSVIWPIVGLFSYMWPMFLGFIFLGLSKFMLYHISEKAYYRYLKAHPYLLIAAYAAILAAKFIR